MLSYFKPKKDETIDLLTIIIILSFLFAFTIQRLDESIELITGWVAFFIFLTLLLFSRLIIMKLFTYKHGFEITLYQTAFSKYGPRKFDDISAISGDYLKANVKGIPSTIISIILYIITFGLFIFPSLWRYKRKKIPHKFLGTQEKFEYRMPIMNNREISDYRLMKVLFLGFIYYLFAALIIKLFLYNSIYFEWFFFTTFWIAFISLIPIVGTEGYDFYLISRLAYISAIVILTIGLLTLLLFESLIAIISMITLLSAITIFVLFYKYFL